MLGQVLVVVVVVVVGMGWGWKWTVAGTKSKHDQAPSGCPQLAQSHTEELKRKRQHASHQLLEVFVQQSANEIHKRVNNTELLASEKQVIQRKRVNNEESEVSFFSFLFFGVTTSDNN